MTGHHDREPRRLVSAEALRHNLAVLRRQAATGAPGVRPLLWPAVKANAYGHGVEAVLRAYMALPPGERPECLCVARVAEGVELRQLGWTARVLVMGPIPGPVPPEAAAAALELCVCAPGHVEAARQAARAIGRTVRVHLKVDTGMGRIGCAPDDVPAMLRLIAAAHGVELAGFMTHLACADEPDRDEGVACTQNQRAIFARAVAALEQHCRETGTPMPLVHLANSAATLAPAPHDRYPVCRPGLAIYGLIPHRDLPGALDLRPALRVVAPVLGWADADGRRLLRVGIGALHGYWPRHAAARSAMLGAGWRGRVVRVEALESLLELDDDAMIPSAEAAIAAGDEALVIGPDRSGDTATLAEALARGIGTINYEIATGLASGLTTELV